ncbi:hypothetical protein TNIN_52641 [Trichonephila inaurata madagascariensis]|nr:hypothetical protein TNIN_52641 [Trichonephila inaurata madagascariensis]
MASSSAVYELSDEALVSFLNKLFAEDFVKMCAHEFQWEDLKEDVIMEIGCGTELPCCKAILKLFPGVKALR